MYTSIKPSHCIPQTYTILFAYYTSNKLMGGEEIEYMNPCRSNKEYEQGILKSSPQPCAQAKPPEASIVRFYKHLRKK